MAEDFQKEIQRVQNALEKEKQVENIGAVEKCPLCKHPSCNQLTEIYYDGEKNIEVAKTWFLNKFKREYQEQTWTKHFKEHVEPFIKSYEVVRQKKLNELADRAAEARQNTSSSPVMIIKQMLMEVMVDAYVAKPNQIISKEDIQKLDIFAKIINNLAKTFQSYQQMELDMMGFGKTEEEQTTILKNYMKSNMGDVIKAFGDMPEVQERIAQMWGISVNEPEKIEVKEV